MRILYYYLGVCLILFILQEKVKAQITTIDYSARLENGILTLENSKISRSYMWNAGNLITQSIADKVSGRWFTDSKLVEHAVCRNSN